MDTYDWFESDCECGSRVRHDSKISIVFYSKINTSCCVIIVVKYYHCKTVVVQNLVFAVIVNNLLTCCCHYVLEKLLPLSCLVTVNVTCHCLVMPNPAFLNKCLRLDFTMVSNLVPLPSNKDCRIYRLKR